jgi:deoxyribodipyrimidine photo-lyase
MTTAPTLAWLKRDLRMRDHAPLAALAAADAAAALFVIEPAWLASPEFSPQHVAHTLACLTELRADLAARGLPLLVRVGEVPAVFDELRRDFAFTELHSHEETGSGWTYARDQAVAHWCRARGVVWHEHAQTGVVRRLRTRLGWAGRWAQRMDAEAVPQPASWRGAALDLHDLPSMRVLGVAAPQQTLPPAGEAAAWATLDGFLAGRGRGYRRALSSPLTAEAGCSRLSVHLAFGSISLRSVHQATEATILSTPDGALAHALRGFAGRLRWHCHFMQKLEDEPAIEHRNFARVCDGLRPGDTGVPMSDADHARLQAWCEGRTGYPMVDACMRSLNATGWLNFRMRALLVSFAAYHLWLHWRAPGLHLARQFLDFEPGIHWSQMQMQSGTTGINTLRIYSPRKQQLDHDPDGVFLRRWLPEWGSDAYPAPIIDERAALAHAKAVMYGLRGTPQARAEADAVQHKHGSRKSGLPPSGQRGTAASAAKASKAPKAPKDTRPSPQGELF